jgi:hypothetical protein
MAEASGSTSDALRVITEKLEELSSSMTSHERTMNEREQVHVAEMSALSDRVSKVVSDQARSHQDEVGRQESHRRTSRRGMQSRSCSFSQSHVRERRGTNDNIRHEYSSVHVQQPFVEASIGVPDPSPTVGIGSRGNINRVITGEAGLLDPAMHMELSYLEPGLVPYVAGDDRLRAILDYRSYRLNIRDGHVSSRASGRISEYANRVRSQTPMRFSGIPAVGALRFLRTLRIAFDDTGISEGVALRLLPHFLEEPATTAFHRTLRIHGGSVGTYPQAVAWFLQTYVPESSVALKLREVSLLSRRQEENVDEFAMRLQAEAALLGDLISERTLRTHFYAGLDGPTATFAQSLLPHGPVMQTFHEAVAHASQVDQSIAFLRPAPTTNVNNRAVVLPSRSNIQRSRGILSIPEAPPEDETMNEASSSLDVDTGVFYVTDQRSRATKQFYCIVCWKQGHFAGDCPLISERDRKEIAARKTAVLALMRDRPGWKNRTGRMYPNIPYQGGVNPSTSNAENPEQSKN